MGRDVARPFNAIAPIRAAVAFVELPTRTWAFIGSHLNIHRRPTREGVTKKEEGPKIALAIWVGLLAQGL